MTTSTTVMPGDGLIATPDFSNDQQIQIAAPPSAVWPWLAQMGFGRAGWYSWDIVDNLGRRSATKLHPQWMIERSGDLIPAGPIRFDTPVVTPPDELVLAVLARSLGPWTIDFTLGYRLEPTALNSTLLRTRARARITGPAGSLFARYLLGPGDNVMVAKQLRGVKQRAELLG